MTISPVVIDAVVAALIIIFAVIQGKKGASKMVLPIVILVLAVIIGGICVRMLTDKLAPFVWDKYGVNIESLLSLKDFDIGQKLVDGIVVEAKIVVEKLTSIAIFIAAFILSLIILNILKKPINKLLHWSAIGWINHLLGFILGIAEGVVLLFVIIRVCGYFDITFFEDIAQGTTLLSQFVSSNLKEVFEFLTGPEIADILKQ